MILFSVEKRNTFREKKIKSLYCKKRMHVFCYCFLFSHFNWIMRIEVQNLNANPGFRTLKSFNCCTLTEIRRLLYSSEYSMYYFQAILFELKHLMLGLYYSSRYRLVVQRLCISNMIHSDDNLYDWIIIHCVARMHSLFFFTQEHCILRPYKESFSDY